MKAENKKTKNDFERKRIMGRRVRQQVSERWAGEVLDGKDEVKKWAKRFECC